MIDRLAVVLVYRGRGINGGRLAMGNLGELKGRIRL